MFVVILWGRCSSQDDDVRSGSDGYAKTIVVMVPHHYIWPFFDDSDYFTQSDDRRFGLVMMVVGRERC